MSATHVKEGLHKGGEAIVAPTPPSASRGAIPSPPEHYDESAITTLAPEQAVEKFDFALKSKLAKKYPASSPEFIDRLINACRIVGEPIEPMIDRYLAKAPGAPPPSPELLAAFLEELESRRP